HLPGAFLALHPGSGSTRKNWPAERFAGLADTLAPGTAYALVEGPADATAVACVLERAPRAVVVRGLSPLALASLLAQASLYVGNDSGVSHLAAAVGAPTLALFGPTDPAVWAPVGPRVATLRAPSGDLERLDVDAVAAYVSGASTSRRLISR
ncbi:MAG TPA: glycosyltransferase family 9 protein, partial [Vicinamibacteria bacterium]|nr:glycosyltransferase family 9 protein [Vicinamibacteria bacterium]